MKNVIITEAQGFLPGSLDNAIRSELGIVPHQISAPGETPVRYQAELTDQQIERVRTRFFSHRVEVEDTPVVDPRDAQISSLRAQIADLETERAESANAHTAELANLQARIADMEAKAKK